ncbi:MAG TPA: response regulator [Elusimicrobiales bacterium]|nr:response regulator [Elusimicrobiales bacterium]
MNDFPYRILIIEDEPLVREMVHNACSVGSNRVFSAGSMEEGEQLLKRNGADLLVLDRMLPDGDGLQFCSKLRNEREYESLPILILSGKAETNEKVLGLKLGADDYLAKPFSVPELKARIDALLRRSRKLSQASYIKRRLWRF